MNLKPVFIRAAVATAFVGFGVTAIDVPHAAAARDVVSTAVDARAPLQATLLPMLSVSASAANPAALGTARIANDEALSVTLMPTVYVNTRAPTLAVITAPVEATRVVAVDVAVPELPRVDIDRVDATPVLHARVMPR